MNTSEQDSTGYLKHTVVWEVYQLLSVSNSRFKMRQSISNSIFLHETVFKDQNTEKI